MTNSPTNQVDDKFIDQLNKHIAHLIQDYIKKLVQHEVDVVTDSEWFTEKIKTITEKKVYD